MKSFGECRFEEPNWILDVEPHVAIRLRRLFRRMEGQFGVIKVRHTDEVAKDLLWFMERYPLDVSSSDLEMLKLEAAMYDVRFEQFTGILSGEYDPREFKMALPPREYQRVAAELILQQRRIMVADDLGLGKSCSAITTFTCPETLPALIVCQTHLPVQWERELHKFIPDSRSHIIKKRSAYDIIRAMEKEGSDRNDFPDVVITSYSKLAGWSDVLAGKVRSVVFDEIQELRHADTDKYRAAEAISSSACYCVGLSATPVYNRGSEMYNIMEIIKPDSLGQWPEFAMEWCGSKYANRKTSSVHDPKAFGTYLREQGLMIRRTRADVGRELPNLIKIPHYVESNPEALKKIEDDILALARTVMDAESTFTQKGQASQEMDWKLRHATGVAKAPYVAEFVKMLLEAEEPKVLLFGWHRDVYDVWMKKLAKYEPALFTGSESAAQKDKAAQRFINDEKCRVMIMSVRSGAGLDGLQYSSCRVAVVGELDWSPEVHNQGIGRLQRDGQDKQITAFYLLSDEGSDPYISDVLGLKRAEIDAMRDPRGSTIEALSRGDESRIKDMAAAILKKSSSGRR